MRAYESIVDPDVTFEIDGAEVKKHALPGPFRWNGETAAVPEAIVWGYVARNTGELRFHGKGHEDLAVHGGGRGDPLVSDGVVPMAVEVEPLLAHQLRAGIAAPDVVRA